MDQALAKSPDLAEKNGFNFARETPTVSKAQGVLFPQIGLKRCGARLYSHLSYLAGKTTGR